MKQLASPPLCKEGAAINIIRYREDVNPQSFFDIVTHGSYRIIFEMFGRFVRKLYLCAIKDSEYGRETLSNIRRGRECRLS